MGADLKGKKIKTIDAISKRLSEIYTGTKIASEELEMAIEQPHFFIVVTGGRAKRIKNNDYLFEQEVTVEYKIDAEKQNKRNELLEMGENLVVELERVVDNDGNAYHAHSDGITYKIDGNTLRVEIIYTYNAYVIPKIAEKMREMETSETIGER